MNPNDPESLSSDAAQAEAQRRAFAESRRLWPDPFAAPDVPPLDELEAFLRNPHDPDKVWLKAQIEERVNCRRAVEELRLMQTLGFKSAEVRRVRHPLPSVLSHAAQSGLQTPMPPPPDAHVVETGLAAQPGPTVGQIWAMTPDVWLWDREHGDLVKRRSWEPQFILLVEGPHTVEGVSIWRAVPCSMDGTWPDDYFANDEIETTAVGRGDWVTHLWAEHPVAASHRPQLERLIGVLDEMSLEGLEVARAAIAEGLPLGIEERSGAILDSEEDAEAFRERERLLFAVNWRANTVDALVEKQLYHGKIIEPSDWETSDFLEPFIAWRENRDRKATARSVQRPPFCLKRRAIAGTGLILSFKTQPTGETCRITVLDGKERSSKLDGAHFVPRNGEPVVIAGGQVVCSIAAIKLGYKLMSDDGKRFDLSDT